MQGVIVVSMSIALTIGCSRPEPAPPPIAPPPSTPTSAPAPASNTSSAVEAPAPIAEQRAGGQPAPSAKQADGGHDHEAPHGGSLIEFGDEFAHLELLLNADTGRLTVYVLDGEAETPVRLAQPAIVLMVTVPDVLSPISVTLEPVENALTGEKAGDTSQFVATVPELEGRREFRGTVSSLTIRGRAFFESSFRVSRGRALAMSQHAVQTPLARGAKPVPVRWAILAGAAIGLVTLVVMSVIEGAEPFDPGTIVSTARFQEMGRHYRQVEFNVLASFEYGTLPGADPSRPVADSVPREIQQLDGQRIGIVGFMLPVDFNGQGVTEFILNASYDMCYFGAPTTPNQFIVVKMKDGRRTRFVHTPIVVFGTLRVAPERRNGRIVSLYQLEADGIGLGAAGH